MALSPKDTAITDQFAAAFRDTVDRSVSSLKKEKTEVGPDQALTNFFTAMLRFKQHGEVAGIATIAIDRLCESVPLDLVRGVLTDRFGQRGADEVISAIEAEINES